MTLEEYLQKSGETLDGYLARKKREQKGETTLSDYLARTRAEVATTDLSDIWGTLEKGGYIDRSTIRSYKTRLDDFVGKYSKVYNQSNEDARNYLENLKKLQEGVDSYDQYVSSFASDAAYEDFYKKTQLGKDLYDQATGAEDFGKYAGIGAAIQNPTFEEADGKFYIFGHRTGAKEIGNIVTFSRDNNDTIRMSYDQKPVGDYRYSNFTDDEVSVYNYWLAKENEGSVAKGTAKAYLDAMDDVLNQREAGKVADRADENIGLQLVFGVAAGLNQFASGVQNMFNTGDGYIAPSLMDYASQYVREDLGDVGGQFLGNSTGQIAYDTVTTVANMLPTIMVSAMTGGTAGSVLGTSLMGFSAGGNYYREFLNSGMSKGQARALSVALGVWEGASEYYLGSIEGLGGKYASKLLNKTKLVSGLKSSASGFTRALMKVFDGVVDASTEGLEEVIQDIGSTIIKGTMTGEWEWSTLEEQAYSFTLGALSAAMMNTPGAVIGNTLQDADLYRNGKSIREMGGTEALRDLAVETANEYGGNDTLSRYAENVVKKPTAMNVGILNQRVSEARNQNNLRSMENALIEQMVSDGVEEKTAKKKSGKIAEKLLQEYNGEEIDLQKMLKDPSVKAVYDKVIRNADSEIGQREEHHAKAKQKIVQEYVQRGVAQAAAETEAGTLTGRFDTADGGRTVRNDTGEAVTIAATDAVTSTDGGKLTLKLQNGETVSASDLSFGTKGEAVLYSVIADLGVSAGTANKLLGVASGTDSGGLISVALGLRDAYWYGKKGVNYNALIEGTFTSGLAEAQRKTAYNLGKIDAVRETAGKAAAPAAKTADKTAKTATKTAAKSTTAYPGEYRITDGKVPEIRNKNLNKLQKSGLSLAKVLSKLGADIYVYESTVSGRQNGTANGYYLGADGSIHIDLNSGARGEGLVAYTLTHEFVHEMEQKSPGLFRKYANLLFEELGNDNKSVTKMLEAEQARMRGMDEFKGLSDAKQKEIAYSEVVAKCSEKIFTDTDVLERFAARVAKADRTLLQKIVDFFQKIIDRLRGDYRGQRSNSTLGEVAVDTINRVTAIRDAFADAMADTVKSYQSETVRAETQTKKEQHISPPSEKVAGGGKDVRFSLRETDREGNRIDHTKEDLDYIRALQAGDIKTAQKMVESAARAAGYTSPKLFHGTKAFGFTEFDLAKMDDRKSIFLTDNERIATSYSGLMGTRTISDAQKADIAGMSVQEVVAELNSGKYRIGNEEADEYHYSYLEEKTIRNLCDGIDARVSEIQRQIPQKIREYADRMVADFTEADFNMHRRLVDAYELMQKGGAKELGTAFWSIQSCTDAFDKKKLHDLERDLRLVKKLNARADSTGVVLKDWSDGYSLDLLSVQDARAELAKTRKSGTYELYADLGKSLQIDCKSRAWNDIRHWAENIEYTMNNTRVERTGGRFVLISTENGQAIPGGELAVNSYTDGMSVKNLQVIMVDKANNVVRILAEELRNTRQISDFALKRGYDSVLFQNIRDNGGESAFVDADEISNVYVLFNPNNIKSADTVTYDDAGAVIPLSERFHGENKDIRYSPRMTTEESESQDAIGKNADREHKTGYSYEELISKPDMKVTVLGDTAPAGRADVVALARKNAAKIGKFNAKDGSVSVYVKDAGADVILSKAGLIHSLDRRFSQNAPATVKAGEILANSVVINELVPKNEKASASYVLIGAAGREGEGVQIVESVVNRFSNELLSMDVLYSINAKQKGTAALDAPLVFNPDYRSTISIAELLEFVNRYFPDILPEDVLRHYGYTERPGGVLGESALFSDRENVSARSLLANALEGVAQNETEKEKLRQYKTKIGLMEQTEKQLTATRAKIRELSFSKGARDTEQIGRLRKTATELERRISYYDRQLFNLEASAPLKNVLSRESARVQKAEAARYREALNAYKKKTAETVRDIVQKNQESRKKAAEGRNKTEMRGKVKKVVGELNAYLKENKVLIGMQKIVAEALDAVNMDTVGADARVAKYDALIAKETDPDLVRELQATRDRIVEQGETLKGRLERLKTAYADIINSDDPLIANAHDEVIENKIDDVIGKVGDTSIRDMTLEQLEEVYGMYRMILTSVRNANKAFLTKKAETITQLGEAVRGQVRGTGGDHAKEVAGLRWLKKFGWKSLKPIYAIRMIGSDTFTELYENVRSGEDAWYRDMSAAKAFREEQYKKHGYSGWDFGKRYRFTAKSGKTFEMTLEQILSLYAYAKRPQAIEHLTKGGIVFDGAIEVTEKKYGVPVKYRVNTATAFNLSEEVIAEICGTLSPAQRAFADEMQAYLSEVMGEKGNEVSLALYGVKLFKEKTYFPLKSARQFLYQQNEVAGEVRIRNSGFSKATVAHANNPIILSNFMDVWAGHCNDMAMYHSFVLPLEDFNRVWNYKTKTDDKAETASVKQALQNAYGTGVNEYISTLLTDLNGGARQSGAEEIGKLMSLAKKGAVFASASVTIQQPSAICRAMAYISPKYFAKTFAQAFNFRQHRAVWEECKKYAPVAGIKEMGYFDTGMGKGSVDWLKAEAPEGLRNKIAAFLKDGSYRDEVLSKAPSMADELTWCYIWNATKALVADTTDLSGEALLTEAGRKFTQVITLTQVYDSVLSRSGLMRSKDTGMKMATAFMAEPTTTMNMVADAFVRGKRIGGKQGAKIISGVVGSVTASIVLNSLLKSIVVAWRHIGDDDDETYAEKYGKAALEDFLDNINPLTYIPFAKDIVSLFQGYDVSRMDMDLFEDLVSALKSIDSSTKSAYQKVTAIIGAVSAFFGIPFRNIERDLRPIVQKLIGAA